MPKEQSFDSIPNNNLSSITTNNNNNNNNNNNDDEEMMKQKQTETQLKNIQDEIRGTQSLTSELLPLSCLTASYNATTTAATTSREEGEGGEQQQQQEEKTQLPSSSSSSLFREESLQLESKYRFLRKVRGDGNCYYRAFLYAVCESVLLMLEEDSIESCEEKEGEGEEKVERKKKKKENEGEKELNRLIELAKNSINLVTQRGYDRTTIEMFYEELVDLFTSLCPPSLEYSNSFQQQQHQQQQQLTKSTLHTTLNEENAMSDYCTWYLRLLTACHLKSDPDRFIHFLDVDDYPGMDVPTFCSREVEPMGRECGMVQVLALAEVMGVRVVIEYMDGRGGSGGTVMCHEFGPEDAKMKIFLLYRPGHYDILYI